MAKSKKSGVKALLFWGLLLGAGFLAYRYHQKGALIDDADVSGKFGAVVDDALAEHGVTDSQIENAVRVERSQKLPVPRTWIETERRVSGVSDKAVEKISASIKKSAEPLKLNSFSKQSKGQETILEFGRDKRVFQRLIFVRSKNSGKKLVAIVIDDVAGRPTDPRKLEAFLSLNIPITFALLPKEPTTHTLAERIHKAGHEIILHQPMEPHDAKHNPPGKAAILKSMTAREIDKRLNENFSDVPYARGFSNHMGSEFTSHAPSMDSLLSSAKVLSAKHPGLFFFDSHTTPHPVSVGIAAKKGVRHLVNDFFLDNEDNLGKMSIQLESLKRATLRDGTGIAIGHIQRKYMAEALRKIVPEFKKEGIQFVYLSDLLQ